MTNNNFHKDTNSQPSQQNASINDHAAVSTSAIGSIDLPW